MRYYIFLLFLCFKCFVAQYMYMYTKEKVRSSDYFISCLFNPLLHLHPPDPQTHLPRPLLRPDIAGIQI